MLEAMATGLPCLVTPYLGLSEGIGRPDEHYLMVDRDATAIADALSDLMQNDTVRSSLAERGKQYVVDNLDQQLSLDRYVALYEELAASATRR